MGAELTKDGIKNKKTEVESQQDISIPVESKRSTLNTPTKRENNRKRPDNANIVRCTENAKVERRTSV